MNREEARIEHFKAVRERRRKSLHWWKYQKPEKQYDLKTIQEMCSELGREIGYLDDVIEMLENRKGCNHCHWIDPDVAHEDEDGPLNYCRACGRKLAQPG